MMIHARKSRGLSQKRLAARIGTSQVMISLIESGEVRGSQFILPICKALGIAPPQHYESEDQRTWAELGHLLRAKHPKQFRRALALVESMIDDSEENTEELGQRRPTSRK